MNLKYDSSDTYSIPVADYAADRGFDFDTDVSDVFVMVKRNRSDSDEDSLATLAIGSGVSKDLVNTEIDFAFDETHYGENAMQAGETYYLAIGLQVTGYNRLLEPDLNDSFITVVSDVIRI